MVSALSGFNGMPVYYDYQNLYDSSLMTTSEDVLIPETCSNQLELSSIHRICWDMRRDFDWKTLIK